MRVVWWLLLASCGDNLVPIAPYEARSGDRIKLRTFVYDDGTRQWDPQQFHDAARDERCAPQPWSDGAKYCTPTAMPTVYRDALCTDELGRWLVTQPAPSYFYREFALLGTETISRVYRRGDSTPPPERVFQLTRGSCVETQ